MKILDGWQRGGVGFPEASGVNVQGQNLIN